MTGWDQYKPGPANGARVEKDGEKWTLVLERHLRHPPEKVWAALTDPAQLREWAPFDVDAPLDRAGTVNMAWLGAPAPAETIVTRSEAPEILEYGDLRWRLQPSGTGTRLTLWHKIDRRFIHWGAAGWHISFDVLDSWLDGERMGRMAGPAAMQFEGWQSLRAEYGAQFGVEH